MGARRSTRRTAGLHAPQRAQGPPSVRLDEEAWRRAGIVLLVVATAAFTLVAIAFHSVGDYFTETDFYGAYALGAEALRGGHFDGSRYGAYGPVYELTLAAVGLVWRDLFTAARILSLASAAAVLVLCWDLAGRRFGARAAFWLVGLLAVNPAFGRYAISACGDMLGAAWMMACVWVLLSGKVSARVAGGALAGMFAALGTLTRYNLVCLVPAGLVVLLLDPRGSRWAVCGAFMGAFLALTAPFTLSVISAGHLPGETLFRDASFYLADSPSQELERRYGGAGGTTGPQVGGGWARVALRFATGVPSHLVGDAQTLLGWPAAGLVLVGLGGLAASRQLATLVPFAPFAAFGFAALAPVYYSDRYSLSILPLYLLPAAAMLGTAGRNASGALTILAIAAGGVSLRDSIRIQSYVARSIPTEALESARVLRRLAGRGDHIMARKPHIAWLAGLEPVLMPDAPSLDSLASYCRERNVRWIYFSWLEGRLRSQFRYLLDTTATPPGLTVVHVTSHKPSVTYRIGPSFGAPPPWWGNEVVERRIRERVEPLLGQAPTGPD
jgi:dolichyl-phosphate-mannose-protein mannosyltransferase